MPPVKKSGFKQCEDCDGQMSITDPHRICIWCLGSDHDVGNCVNCQKMNPKTLKDREAKMFLAKAKNEKRRRRSRVSTSPAPSRQLFFFKISQEEAASSFKGAPEEGEKSIS